MITVSTQVLNNRFLTPFLVCKNILSDIGNETKRLGTQGAMELASALFSGQGFVPYGPGQYTPSTDLAKEQSQAHEPAQPQIERAEREV